MENNGSEMNMKQLAKELRMTRVFCVISSALTVCLLLGGFLLFSQLQPIFRFLQETKPIMEELSALDVESVNSTLEQVNATLGSIDWQQVSDAVGSVDWKQVSDAVGSVDWQQASDALAQLDVEAINNAIEGLDTEELSEAIENLNNASDAIESLGEKLRSFTNLFER